MNESLRCSTPYPGPARREPLRNPQGFKYLTLLILWPSLALAQSDGPLSIADLAAYRAALEPTKPDSTAPLQSTFRDLWDHPDDFRGHRVAVSGRVERVFHQGPVGQFPALAEVWVVDAATNPLCLVFPESPDAAAPKPGDEVRLEGTYLRRIRYRGGDVDRLAPLIVGPGPGKVDRQAAPAGPVPSKSPFEGIVVAVLGGVVVLALLRAHLRRPVERPIVDGPPPEFQDGEAAGYDGSDPTDGPSRD
jgi:hypothetical protein